MYFFIELGFAKFQRRMVSHLSANGETTPRVLTFNQRSTRKKRKKKNSRAHQP